VPSGVPVDHAVHPHHLALRRRIELLNLGERTGGLTPLIQQTDAGDFTRGEPPDLLVRSLRGAKTRGRAPSR
jgi:hypothetical protein